MPPPDEEQIEFELSPAVVFGPETSFDTRWLLQHLFGRKAVAQIDELSRELGWPVERILAAVKDDLFDADRIGDHIDTLKLSAEGVRVARQLRGRDADHEKSE